MEKIIEAAMGFSAELLRESLIALAERTPKREVAGMSCPAYSEEERMVRAAMWEAYIAKKGEKAADRLHDELEAIEWGKGAV